MTRNYGLGRLVARDHRDEQHPLLALTSTIPEPQPPYQYWHGSMFLDQKETSQCVEYSWHHYCQTGRIRPNRRWPYWVPGEPYAEMQREDEWEGEDYDGTSVRAGAKVLQKMGLIDSYVWAWDLPTTLDAVLRLGPVVVGTWWYESMFEPVRGRVKVEGRRVGGHAYLIDGANKKQGMFRCKNSWGREWGWNGRFWIPFEDMERLINEEGEVCVAVEKADG